MPIAGPGKSASHLASMQRNQADEPHDPAASGTWLKPGSFMELLGEKILWVLWLGKTLNAWISKTIRHELMRLTHRTGHF